MHASLTAVGVVVGIALFVGCSQPITSTSPTSLSPAGQPIASSEANGAGTGIHANDQKVPLKGRLEGTATVTPGTPPFLSVSIEGTGNATYIGRFTIEVPHIVNASNRTSIGTYEFTTPNGDTMTAGFSGQATLTAPGMLSIIENATITGGTGRFAGSAGTFRAERVFNQVTGVTTGSFEGTISAPGAGTP
jgi:hypothetical protein